MKAKQFEEIALVNRLLGYYLQTGQTPESALQQVESKLGSSYASAVETVKRTVVGKSDTQADGSKPSLMTSLTKDVRELGGEHHGVALNTSQNLHKAAVGFKSCSRFFSSLYRYPMFILLVSILIYIIYRIFVFPQMVLAIGELDMMPALTLMVFSSISGIVISVVMLLLIVVAITQNRKLLRAFASYQPSDSWLGRLTATDQHQRYLLFLVYLITLLKSGANSSDSIQRAKEFSKIKNINTKHYDVHQTALSVLQHAEINLVEEEAIFQFNDVLNNLDSVLASKQEKVLFMFQSFIFSFVGLFIIAMYLPIFQLGSTA